MNFEKIKSNILVGALIVVSVFFLCLGAFYLLTVDPRELESNRGDYISAFFSISGIMLFCAALVYQIREYRLQVEELKKSVDAQTNASKALEQQKELLSEQNTSILLFTMIESFNQFKDKPEVSESIDKLYKRYTKTFQELLDGLVKEENKKDINQLFAYRIKEIMSSTLSSDPEFHNVRRFVQFVYNILYVIGEKNASEKKDWFTPFLYNQLTRKENLIICLSNLVDYGVPISDKITWRHQITLELLEMIDTKDRRASTVLNAVKLTNEFSRLTQKL